MATARSPAKKRALATALAIAIAGPAEGIRQFAYYDPPGILTVCKGHTGPDVVKGRKYSLEECDKFMDNDMRIAITIVDTCVPGLPVEVLAAFADATFNIGSKVACDTRNSTAARFLAMGDFVSACKQLLRWDKAKVAGFMVALPGLTKRRIKEMTLCLTGVSE